MEQSPIFLSVEVSMECILKLIKTQASFRGYITRKEIYCKKDKCSFEFLTLFTSFEHFYSKYSNFVKPEVIRLLESNGMYFTYEQISSLSWTGPIFINNFSVYYGEINSMREPHGNGIIITSGYIYEGMWFSGEMHGKGRRINSYGVYIGNMRKGKRDGRGVMMHIEGKTYDGSWKNNEKCGLGKYMDSSNKNYCYKGLFKDELPNIFGEFEIYGKYVYLGSFSNGCMEDFGQYKYNNGDIYCGELLDGEYHGLGYFIKKNGWKYFGNWVKGKRNGKGRWSHSAHGSYQCEWKDGNPIGEYIFEDTNKNILKGIWINEVCINYLDEIIPNFYLGSAEAAQDDIMLKGLGIRAIVRVLDNEEVGVFPSFTYHCISIKDSKTEDIIKFIPGAYAFIDEWIKKGEKVLVHCFKGVSRSASIVIAYLMINKRISFDEAFKIVKEKRKIVNPNKGFQEALKSYSENLMKSDAQ